MGESLEPGEMDWQSKTKQTPSVTLKGSKFSKTPQQISL